MANQPDTSKVSGGIGSVPPPDAPHETAEPIRAETLAVHRQMAQQHEKVLAPLNPQRLKGPLPVPQPDPPATVQISEIDQLVADVFGAPVPDRPGIIVAGQGDPLPAMDPEQGLVDQLDDLPPLTEEDRARMPAASMSESPAKGILPDLIPRAEPNKFEGISRGGFSDIGEAQYFPLDGSELKELVLSLFDVLSKQIQNDLRFSMALTYPRVRARVRIEIEGAAEDKDGGFTIEKVRAPKPGAPGGTALDIARQRANQIVFVVEAVKQEFSEDGTSEAPPDQIRDELQLHRPHKQIIQGQMPGQQFMVDVGPGSDLASVTR